MGTLGGVVVMVMVVWGGGRGGRICGRVCRWFVAPDAPQNGAADDDKAASDRRLGLRAAWQQGWAFDGAFLSVGFCVDAVSPPAAGAGA